MANSNVAVSQNTLDIIARVIRLSITLGICLQLVTLAAKLLGGMSFPGLRLILDFSGSITWSIIVCVGVGLGAIILRSGVVLAGMLSAVFAPIGLAAAKAVQNAVGLLLDIPGPSITNTLLVLGLIKAIEYGILGVMLAVMMKKEDQHIAHYVLLGLGTGVVFGSILVLTTAYMAGLNGVTLTIPQLTAQTVNEVLFPIGCALVIYTVQFMRHHVVVTKDQA